ncbi:4-coumarate--CoA ligase-like 7 [Acorus gramineus]|uniref:4-coumarate--CoA ligase n=1 Tax=Acorus gramineus TaxID=55184 RepID=A0AAV9B1V8_ACOGR|nr:4-coumarate--CoA ligase-like 7 [Acorus gramineus]
MAETDNRKTDLKSGYSYETKTFHSLRPPVPLPPLILPLSASSHAASLLRLRPPPLLSAAFIDSSTGLRLSFPDFLFQSQTLASSLRSDLGLSKGDVALILAAAPSRLEIPVLRFALLSIGVVAAPVAPICTDSEIARVVRLGNPKIAFATSATAYKLPGTLITSAVLVDSDRFRTLISTRGGSSTVESETTTTTTRQSDPAVILFSSGTTGRSKPTVIPHRSYIAMNEGFFCLRQSPSPEVVLLLAPMFHTFGFIFCLKQVALGETTVLMERFSPRAVAAAVEEHRVTTIVAAPPVVVALARAEEGIVGGLDTLQRMIIGGAPLGRDSAEQFNRRFPHVRIELAYGSTEAGGISRMIGDVECENFESVGRLSENIEAKIVDPVTGDALGVGQPGELWVRGPAVMTGYIGDAEANASTFSSDGWLKTGDLCRFDQHGFLYVVDRIKELIKYKAYQVPPVELEHLLRSIPDIIDAAVIPCPSEEVGQIPMACVVRMPGSSIDEARVAPYKKIRRVVFVELIPKSASGKILRRELLIHALPGSASRL